MQLSMKLRALTEAAAQAGSFALVPIGVREAWVEFQTAWADPQALIDREVLGRLVREVWVAFAREQPRPKPSWLLPWEELTEPEREVDRRIGETVAAYVLVALTGFVTTAPLSVVEAAHEVLTDLIEARRLAERK